MNLFDNLRPLKPLGYYLDRLKLSLRSSVCCICRSEATLREAEFVCDECQSQIKLRDTAPVLSTGQITVFAACDFPLQLKQWLYSLKFNDKNAYALRLTEVMLHYWNQLPGSVKTNDKRILIVPIPAHRNTQQHHHLSLIFQPFASELGVDYVQNLLTWGKPVHPQHTLYGRKLRKENVREAFQVDLSKIPQSTQPLHIIVVDDLITTGATITEAIQTLQEALPNVEITGLTLCNLPMGLSR